MAARMPGPRRRTLEPIPDALIKEALPPDTKARHVGEMRRLLHVAMTRARRRLVLAYPAATERGAAQPPSPFAEEARRALGAEWERARGGAVRARRDAAVDVPAPARRAAHDGRAGRRPARRAALRHRPRRLARRRALPRAAQALRAAGAHARRRRCRSPRRCRRSTRGCCRPPPPSSARSSRPPRSTSTCSTPSATRSCARGPSRSAPSRRWSSSCRAAATGSCSAPPTSRPTGPAR